MAERTITGGTSMVRMVEIGGRGRALVASQPLIGGQIVLRDSPILLYSALPLIEQSQQQQKSSYCYHCFRILPQSQSAMPTSSSSSLASPSVSPCPRCLQHVFCSPNCLTLALASSHSPWVCQSLSRLRDCPSAFLHQPSERQVQARFLIAAYNLAFLSPSDFQTLVSLQGRDSPSEAAAAHFLHSLIASLCTPPPRQPESVSLSLELTAALLAKDKLNAFGLMEPFSLQEQGHGQRSVRAYGIYPVASFFNHDCLPNACRFDYVDTASDHNTDIIIRMIHDVSQGREICLSYFPVNLSYSNRQNRLLEDYGFTCDCDRCKVEATWSDNEEAAEEEEVVVMDEDDNQQMVPCDPEHGAAVDDSDFPHAYFFLRYMCTSENCGGTLAPLPPSDATLSTLLECNVCGCLKHDEHIDAKKGEDNLSMDD